MKEITLLIFIFACCYFSYFLIINIIHPNRYKIVFFIPQIRDSNLTFGSMFFCFAISLNCNNTYLSITLNFLGFLLLIYGYWLHCYKNFFYGGTCYFLSLCKYIATKQIQKQIKLNQLHKHIYNKQEAARTLGISLYKPTSSQSVNTIYNKIISNLIQNNFTPQELITILEQAKQIFAEN